MRGRAGRKDYALARDEQLTESLRGNVDENGRRKESASVFRLLGLAKEEACVRFPLFLAFLLANHAVKYADTPYLPADSVPGDHFPADFVVSNRCGAKAGRSAHRYMHSIRQKQRQRN